MKKIILVDKCSNCPYVEFSPYKTPKDTEWLCKKSGNWIKVTKTFPPTCPLDKD